MTILGLLFAVFAASSILVAMCIAYPMAFAKIIKNEQDLQEYLKNENRIMEADKSKRMSFIAFCFVLAWLFVGLSSLCFGV